MAYMEFLNPRRESPYASRTKHPIYRPRKPLVWQNDMAEIRETYRRVAHIKDTGYSGFSCLDPARTANTLSRNRVARRSIQHSFEPVDSLNSSTPYEAFNHVQNVRKMCKRIQSLGSLTERKKNPWDVELYPALIRRPSTACPIKHPICHRGCGQTRPFSVPTYSNRTPRCYSHAPFSTLLDISNKPEEACHACHFKAPFDRPSQQDISYHSRSAVYSTGMMRSRPSSPNDDFSRSRYLPHISKLAITDTLTSTNLYMSQDHDDLLELRRPPPVVPSERYHRNRLQDQTSSRVLIEKPLSERSKLVERRYPRGQSKNSTVGGLSSSNIENNNVTEKVVIGSDTSSEVEKVPPRRCRTHGSKTKASFSKKSAPLEGKASKLSLSRPPSRSSSRRRLSADQERLRSFNMARSPSRLGMDRSNLSSQSTECCSSKGLSDEEFVPACAQIPPLRIDDINSSLQKVKFEDTVGNSAASASTTARDPQAEDLKEKEGYYEIGEGGVMVKHSTDPYTDFKTSMMNMIIEEKLQSRPAEIEELFQYYLDLNPGLHHKVIQRVIADIKLELKNENMI